LDSLVLTEKVTDLIFSKKGSDVKVLDLRTLTTIADYFVICSADSDTQVKAIADEIDKKLHEEGIRLWHKEGYRSSNWILLDYVDVVVHVFKKSVREFYNLERLWGDAPLIDAVDKAELKAAEKKPRAKKKKQE
jgi:ribosome-associated protein